MSHLLEILLFVVVPVRRRPTVKITSITKRRIPNCKISTTPLTIIATAEAACSFSFHPRLYKFFDAAYILKHPVMNERPGEYPTEFSVFHSQDLSRPNDGLLTHSPLNPKISDPGKLKIDATISSIFILWIIATIYLYIIKKQRNKIKTDEETGGGGPPPLYPLGT